MKERARDRSFDRIAAMIALLLLFAAFPARAAPKVLMLARVGTTDMQLFLVDEAKPMIGRLREAGYAVEVATPDGNPIGSGALRLSCDVALADVRLDEYAAVLVPCMGAGNDPVPDGMIVLVRKANSTGMIVAAQHSSEVLILAGLADRKTASAPGVVRDGNLITSFNCPFTARGGQAPVDTDGLIRTLIDAIQGR